MGFFDKIKRGITRGTSNVVKGIKRGTEKAVKGVKSAAEKTKKTLEKEFEPKAFDKGFRKGFQIPADIIMEPQRFVERNDPLYKYAGGFSPISFGSSILTAPLTSTGTLMKFAVNKDMQRKLRQGDADTIIDLATAPLGLIPLGGGGAQAAEEVVETGAKQGAKEVAKVGAKKITKKAVTTGAKSAAKSTAKGVFDERLLKLKPIKDIPKQPFVKQTLSKAQRLKNAKSALREAGKLGQSVKGLF